MDKDNWGRKAKGSGNYGSRGVWRQRSSPNTPPPPFAGQRSVPSWEKKFCESIGLVPWHKLLEAKKFMYLYEDVVRWNDTAAEEAFRNAKSRFWAEMNGLPCNIKLPDPDIYIDKVDWNTDIDPELLLDLERGPDMQSKSGGAEGDVVMQIKPFVLDSEPFLCNNNGWGDVDEVPVPVPPTGSAESQGQKNLNMTADTDSCNVEANQCGAWDVQEGLDGSRGWDNWDDDDRNNNASKCNLEEIGNKNSWDEAIYGNGSLASDRLDPWQAKRNQRYSNECAGNSYGWNHDSGWGQGRVTHSDSWDHGHYSPAKNVAVEGIGRNPTGQHSQWRRKDCGGYEGGEKAPELGASFKTSTFAHDGYRPYRGLKNNAGRRRQGMPRWADRKPSYGRW